MTPKRPGIGSALASFLNLDRRVGVILIVSFLFLLSGTSSALTFPILSQAATPTPIPSQITSDLILTPTQLPRELLQNGSQTIGLTIAASILVLIVVVAVVNALLRGDPADR
jgi:hypothetical protein